MAAGDFADLRPGHNHLPDEERSGDLLLDIGNYHPALY
jgi:hypothetical protein